MNININQKGATLIAIIATMLILAVTGVVLISLVTTGSDISINQLQSEQALHIAAGGLEFEQRSLARNLNWYRSTSDPIATTTRSLGAGSFEVYTNLPATALSRRLDAADTTAGVYTTQQFPSSGFLQIENTEGNSEFAQYTGTSGGNRFTGLTRNMTIGSVSSNLYSHGRNDVVYPVTTLITPLSNASCSTIPNPFQIASNNKFLNAGTIMVISNCTLDACTSANFEQITYSGSSTTGGVTTLTGVRRCQNTAAPAAISASAGDPVTSVQENLSTNSVYDYEAGTVSTGAADNARRELRKTVQR